MGRFLGKRKGAAVGEIAVVGVRTRARAALAMAATSGGENKIRKVSATMTPYNVLELSQLSKRRRRRSSVAPGNSVSFRTDTTATSTNSVSEVFEMAANCSTGEICSDFPATSSCYPGDEDCLEITADPEVATPETSPRCFDYFRPARTARRERNTGESDDQDSPPKSTGQIMMPSDSEIEDFFSAAEKDIHKRFTDKYNFDIVKDVPLEGRYEWVPIKP